MAAMLAQNPHLASQPEKKKTNKREKLSTFRDV
jgi:hypothetical protein